MATGILEVVGQPAQAGAEDDADLGHEVGPGADGGDERARSGRLVDRGDGPRRVERATDVGRKGQVGHAGLQNTSRG